MVHIQNEWKYKYFIKKYLVTNWTLYFITLVAVQLHFGILGFSAVALFTWAFVETLTRLRVKIKSNVLTVLIVTHNINIAFKETLQNTYK